MNRGKTGQAYNVGSNQEKQNIEVVKGILKSLNKSAELIEFVKDRPGHDFRYSLNTGKITKELKWKAKTEFRQGLVRTVRWYIKNQRWTEDVIG